MPLAWLLLIHRIPPEPARHRVAVWRRLKGTPTPRWHRAEIVP